MKLIGEDRNQFQIICLENMVSPESHARAVDAFVDFLNLKKLGFKIKEPVPNPLREGNKKRQSRIYRRRFIKVLFLRVREPGALPLNWELII